MSYSFNVKAATKALAKQAVAAKVEEIAQNQPIHARDRAAILANSEAVIDLLADDETKDVTVSCNGFLSWSGTGDWVPETAAISSASVGCSAGNSTRE